VCALTAVNGQFLCLLCGVAVKVGRAEFTDSLYIRVTCDKAYHTAYSCVQLALTWAKVKMNDLMLSMMVPEAIVNDFPASIQFAPIMGRLFSAASFCGGHMSQVSA
jgi:hypothetical protein